MNTLLCEIERFVEVCKKYGNQLLEQSIRNRINRYAHLASIPLHITLHMFRHTFATALLEKP